LATVSSGAPARRASADKQRRRLVRRPVIIVSSIVLGWVLVALALGFVMDAAYAGKALPGFVLAGHSISGMTSADIGSVLTQAQNDISVDLTIGSVTHHGTGTDMGITVDSQRVLAAVAQESKRTFWIYHSHQATTIPLTVSIDAPKFNTWLSTTFADQYVAPTDAGLTYNTATHQFDTVDAVPGTGATSAQLASLAAMLSASGHAAYTMTLGPIPAPITDQQALMAATRANATLSTTCALTSDEQTVYTLSADDIGALTTVAPNPTGGLAISYDPGAVTGFVEKTVAAKINLKPVTQKQTVDETGKILAVSQKGVAGRTLINTAALGGAVAQCLTGGQDTSIPVTFTPVPYTTDAVVQPSHPAPPAGSASTHWADVNLTRQTVTLMNGSTPGQTFTVSSGKASTPTPTGTFHVYAQVPLQPMRGCDADGCWDYENVHWATWFYQDYGFHEAYWRNDFGTPVSHGCINMKLADAKAVYDWLGIGDAVDIHT